MKKPYKNNKLTTRPPHPPPLRNYYKLLKNENQQKNDSINFSYGYTKKPYIHKFIFIFAVDNLLQGRKPPKTTLCIY